MKTLSSYFVKLVFLLCASFFVCTTSHAQGRVVVNEFMPWSGCNTTSEFIELMNFGPGPMNIGCYIVTNGQYSVTIPANTIIAAGEYYVLSGQNTLNQGCGNIDSAIGVDLNWTTCNCTNLPIPTTGDGFMKNGGSSNEKIVLLDPNLNVLDAVSRSSTPSSSVSITTASLSNSCTSRTFDLSTMPISYEAVNVATGIDNSFARRVDGDCGWVKTTDISANAPNKTGSSSSASYTFTTLNASQCNGTTGSISINVSASNVASLFPMTYTLAYDADSNNLFNAADQYTYGIDSSSPSVDINNLFYGRYRITVGSSSGCNLKSFDFFIFNCYGVILPYKIIAFDYFGKNNDKMTFSTRLKGINYLDSLIIEGADGNTFESVLSVDLTDTILEDDQVLIIPVVQPRPYTFYRIKLMDRNNVSSYSKVVKITTIEQMKLWPNPCNEKMYIKIVIPQKIMGSLMIFNYTGQVLIKESVVLKKGTNILPIVTTQLRKGPYQLIVKGSNISENCNFYKN
ncbi:MAG TPA: lamin tail domain-containing protein [Flavitalea sp.]|nr:lamin tail domain-containing protein [Flavitalea sp.]